MITDSNGLVAERHDYLPFGEEVAAGTFGRNQTYGSTAGVINKKFTGKERDSESGLDYFGARYYGSALGRFTSPDWSESPEPLPYADLSDPQTLNLYGYVRNNPVSKADIDGHDSLHTCTGAEQGAGKCQAGDVALQKGNGLGTNIKTSVAAAATAVGNGIGKVSDFLNTAPGIGLVAGMAIFAETGGQEESPALVEAGEELESAVSSIEENVGSQMHHIATDKNISNGFTAAFKRLFAKAGMTLQDDDNRVSLPGHMGRHTNTYHQSVLDRLTNATQGLSGAEFKQALLNELRTIRQELLANPTLPYQK